MRYLTILLGLLLTACSSPADPSASAGTDAPVQPSRSATPPTAVTQAESPSSTLQLSPAPSTTALPTPFGATAFTDPDDCTNVDVGYRVAYPNAWYSNAPSEGIAACWLFAPTDFEVAYGTEIPPQVAIVIRRLEEWNYGAFSGRRVLSDRSVVVDGRPARVQEIEITERDLAFAPGDRFTEYVIELPDGAYLVADTYLGPDYESARTVLNDMMGTIQIGLP